jgi:hypothetical protein
LHYNLALSFRAMLGLDLMLSRRHLLQHLLSGICLAVWPGVALAENGSGGGGGNSGSGSSGGGGSGSGSSGGGGSGSGGNDSSSGSSGSGKDSGHDGSENDAAKNQDEARGAVLKGDATALRDILAKVRKNYQGDIVHVDLKGPSQHLVYQIRLVDPSGKFLNLRVDAKSGAIIGQSGN